jgi:hypothetical protein
MTWEEGLAGFRDAFTRAHDDAVRLAFEAGKKDGQAIERARCLDICATVKPCASGVEMRTTIRAEIASGAPAWKPGPEVTP